MIIFLYGEDTFRSRQKLSELKDKFKKDVDSSGDSLVTLDGEKLTLDDLNRASSAPSLFSKRRMIIIDNLFENKNQTMFDAVLEYLKDKLAGDNILVFRDEISGLKLPKYKSRLFSFLKKPILKKNKEAKSFVQEFKPLSSIEVTNWIRTEVEKRSGKISLQAATTLSSLLGSDLWQTNNELDKLISYKKAQIKSGEIDGQNNQIETKDVQEFVKGNFDDNIFALTDAIGTNNKALALKLFEQQLEGGANGIYLMTMITRQFKLLLQIKDALEKGVEQRNIASMLKVHPFAVQKGMVQVRNFSLDVLKKVFSSLVEIDRKLKTGKSDVKMEIDLLLVKI